MADDRVPDESNLTKRERQKLRREQRLAREHAQMASARRKRMLLTGVMILLVLGLVGWGVGRWINERRERQAAIDEAVALQESLGCTDVQELPNLGASHFSGPELPTSPPEAIYPDRPTTSGTHLGSWARNGVYDHPIDERLLVHNLEHGYVLMYYTQDADPDEVEALKDFARREIAGNNPKLVVTPWADDELPDGANFAYVAWDFRQMCEQFHEGIPLAFLADFHGINGRAPEKTAPAGQGVEPPEDGPLLYPPLGQGQVGDDAPGMDDEGDEEEETGTDAEDEPTDTDAPS